MAVDADRRGLELIGSLAPEGVTRVRGDAGRLRQILVNLGNNAVKFTEHGEIEIRLTAEVVAERVRRRGVVRDTGIGISEDKQAMIFESFTQAHFGDARNFGGTGLGLAIVQRLVRATDGTVSVASGVDQGTTFTFTVMLEPADAVLEAPAALRGIRALVVDANAARARVLEETLRLGGALSVAIASPEEAAAQRRATWDVVILGAAPTSDYANVLASALATSVPVIALRSIRGADIPFGDVPIAMFLPKPLKQRALVACVDDVVRRAPSRRPAVA